MRKNKHKLYNRFRVLRWYQWPEFTELVSEVYEIPFDYRFIY